jgi:phosphoserine phosphatase (EC 3.1.3.3)
LYDVYKEIHLTKGATGLIETLHAKGWKVGLVSGGFHEIVDKIARDLKNRLCFCKSFVCGKMAI